MPRISFVTSFRSVVRLPDVSPARFRTMMDALRPYHWPKNFVFLLPLIVSHRIFEASSVFWALRAMVSFSLISSAGYIFNDLCDVEADRHHQHKKMRPFASGTLSLDTGLALMFFCFIGAFLSSAGMARNFQFMIGIYFLFSTVYTVVIKHIVILDVVALALFYCLRLAASLFATQLPMSRWLFGFSFFFFLSIAVSKRSTELIKSATENQLGARGYRICDRKIVTWFGLASGLIAVLISAWYIPSDEARLIYKTPVVLGVIPAAIAFWLARLWWVSARRQLCHDPVLFVLKDKLSYCLGIFLALAMAWAARN